LYAEDPKFASAVRSARTRRWTRRWIVLAVVGVIAGLGIILIGLAAKLIFLGVIGFVLIVASCAYTATMLRGRRSHGSAAGAPSDPGKQRKPGVRSRMEDRLRRRFEES
jgi:hypothetical protein